jgi:hypothetical protein
LKEPCNPTRATSINAFGWKLIGDRDGPSDPDADRVWLDEVQRRSAEFEAGLVKPIPVEEVFERVRSRLEQDH